MLRLWPERLTASVFPHAGHLHRARGQQLAGWRSTVPVANFDEGLGRLLDAHVPRAVSSLELIVSDHEARLVPLPWQKDLVERQQHLAYARGCFAHAGFVPGDEWVVNASYRRFGSMGLGLAMPRSVILGVREHLAARGMRLRSILPACAWAYWHVGGVRGKCTVLLLCETRRLSALLFDGQACVGFHVQPIGEGLADAVLRIKALTEATLPSISLMRYWMTAQDPEQQSVIENAFPAVRVATFEPLERW